MSKIENRSERPLHSHAKQQNAKVEGGDEECLGALGYGDRNDRAEDLVNFVIAHGFKIMNTFRKEEPIRRPNYETLNEIVHIMADKHQIVKNVAVMNELNIGSDHRKVRCRVKIDTKRERRHLFHHTPEHLRVSPFYVEEFTIKLQNRNAALEEEDGNINETTVTIPKTS